MRKIGGIAVVLLSLLAGACGGNGNAATENGADGESASEDRFLLEIVADEFSFDLVDTVPVGYVDARLENVGKQPHHALIFKLNEGTTYAEFEEAVLKDDSKFPVLAERWGGVDRGITAGTGEIEKITQPYEAGTYAVVCFIRDIKTSKNHYELGMMSEFTVE